MSSLRGGQMYADADDSDDLYSQPSAKPTGLRPRKPTPYIDPPISRIPNYSGAAHFSTPTGKSDAGTAAHPRSSPLNPASSTGQSKKRGWISSASKHLGLLKSREKMDSKQGTQTAAKTLLSLRKTSHKNTERTLASSAASHTPIPSERYKPPLHPSPADKPLPSLPVAAVNFGSPVRRSLIDCTERPLRRSLSPVGRQDPEEEWPAMEPSKSGIAPASGQETAASYVKPSLGESFIEGMRGLKIEDSKGEDVNKAGKLRSSTPDKAPKAGNELKKTSGGTATLSAPASTSDRPLSSSQLPKPRDSMLQSLARHVDTPSVRQTKTSAMRLRRSIGKTAWGSGEKKQEKDSRLNAIREKVHSPAVVKARQTSPGGPFRSTSRGRHAVTARGSPYTIPPRVNNKLNKALPDTEHGIDIGRDLAVTPPTNLQQSQGREITSGQPSTFSRPTGRQSSIPLPSRSQHLPRGVNNRSPDHEDHSSKWENDTPARGHGREATEAPTTPAIGTEVNAASRGGSDTGGTSAARDAELLSMKEVLSSPAPYDDEPANEGRTSPATVHGSDPLGGFRVKRVRNTSKGGPTLRITDSASRILLGDEGEAQATDADLPLRHKTSARDLRQPSAVKDQSRRSSAILARPLSFARSITERSQTAGKGTDDEESRKLINNDDPDEGGLPAELPGHEPEAGTHPSADTHTSWDAMHAAPLGESIDRGASSVIHGDWPCKDFANFKVSDDPPAPASEEMASPAASAADLSKPSSSRTSVRSRPSTIVLRQAPTKEISPFLFQDLEQEKATQEKYRKDFVDRRQGHGNNATPSSDFPPRTSSRKPKPPPIIVSSPERGPLAKSVPFQAGKAYGVDAGAIRRPKDVRTFSQSTSPKTDSTNAKKVAHKLSYSPSSSSKKVISNIRGLFHKRSIESTTNTTAAMSEDKPAGRSRLPGSMRRKPVPGHKLTNPLSLNAHGSTGTEPGLNGAQNNADLGERAVLRNPFISPTTPFTATVRPSPEPKSPSPPKGASPALSPSSPVTPGTSPSLASASSLTHTLLDLARAEAHPQRKTSLIELSKCMVEVVNSARDAEKAMEKAKMEAARAEVSWLKVQKEVSTIEGAVRAFLK